jgi:tetratricopeptide (TPR) repeat protein
MRSRVERRRKVLAPSAGALGALLLSAGCGPREPLATPPTWSADVAPIVHRHCAPCHRPGSTAPFSLLTFEDARRRARSMAEAVEIRVMPPFLPEPGYGRFRDARFLSAEDIDTLIDWSAAGAPLGDEASAPAPPTFIDGFELGEPDAVAEMPASYTLSADGPDVYRNFLMPLTLPAGTRVRALELDPGNESVVHHAALFADTTGTARRLDGRQQQPGYDEMVGGTAPGGHFVGWTPGRGAVELEPGMAWEVEEGTDLVVQMHLLPSGRLESVRARVGLWTTDEPVERRPVIAHLLATKLDISAGDGAYRASDAIELPIAVTAHSVYPHAHYLGREIKAWAELPDGREEPLLWIKRWSFDWQDAYRYAEPVLLPAGSKLRLDLIYDNSAGNAANPSDPPRRVRWGPSSHDEMGDLWLELVPLDESERGVLEETLRRHERERFREGYELRARLDPNDTEAHARLGIGLVQEGRHADAVPHLETALRRDGDAWDLNYNLAVALAALGRYDEAQRRFDAALRADPGDSRTHNALAGALLAAGDLRGAIEHYRRAVELRPTNADTQSNLGVALQHAGDLAGAEAAFAEALRLDRGHSMAQLNYAGLLSQRGRDPAAVALLEALLEREPDRFDAHVNLARSLARLERFEDAERHLRRALEQRPEDAEIHYLLGLTLARRGRLQEAVAALETALRYRPDHELARQDLGALRAAAAESGGRGF